MGMTKQYQLVLATVDNLSSNSLTTVGEGDFIKLLDAADIEYELTRFAPPGPDVPHPQTKPLHKLEFEIVDHAKCRRVLTVFFNAGRTLCDFSDRRF